MKSRPPTIHIFSLPLAIISGVALAYAMPSKGIGILGWIALAPMLAAARAMRPAYATGLGLITALVCGLVLAEGRATMPFQVGNLVAAFGGVALVLAFVCAAASCAAKQMSAAKWITFIACAGVTAEFLSRFAFPVTLAISQYESPSAMRVASCLGVWGVSFLLWLGQAAFAMMLTKPKPAIALLVLALALMYPRHPLHNHAIPGPTIRAAAVQAAEPWGATALTRSLRGAQVIVWPEHLMDPDSPHARYAARRSHAYLVASIRENAKPKPYNSARLIDPTGRTIQTVRKQHLFGRERFDFQRGRASTPAKCPGFTPGVAICFDTEFTDVVRDLTRKGADIILVPNHDPELSNFLFHHLHAAVIAFRAAENGVPIVWSESNGLSMIVASDGSIISQAPTGKAAVASANVTLRHGTTIFTRIGDLFAYLCLAAFALLPLTRRTSGKQPTP